MKLSNFLHLLSEIFTTVEKLGVDTEPVVAALFPAAGAIEGAVVAGAGIGESVLNDIASAATTPTATAATPAAPAPAVPAAAAAPAPAPTPTVSAAPAPAALSSTLTDPADGNAAGAAAAETTAQAGPGLHTTFAQ